MPLEIKSKMKYKDPNTGNYISMGLLSETITHDSEAFAKGTRNNIPITDNNDPAFQKNAKYYMDQTQVIKNQTQSIKDSLGALTEIPEEIVNIKNNIDDLTTNTLNLAKTLSMDEIIGGVNIKSLSDGGFLHKGTGTGTYAVKITEPIDLMANKKYYWGYFGENTKDTVTIQLRKYIEENQGTELWKSTTDLNSNVTFVNTTENIKIVVSLVIRTNEETDSIIYPFVIEADEEGFKPYGENIIPNKVINDPYLKMLIENNLDEIKNIKKDSNIEKIGAKQLQLKWKKSFQTKYSAFYPGYKVAEVTNGVMTSEIMEVPEGGIYVSALRNNAGNIPGINIRFFINRGDGMYKSANNYGYQYDENFYKSGIDISSSAEYFQNFNAYFPYVKNLCFSINVYYGSSDNTIYDDCVKVYCQANINGNQTRLLNLIPAGVGLYNRTSPWILHGYYDDLKTDTSLNKQYFNNICFTQMYFYNICVKIRTGLSPNALLGACLGIEAALGRVRSFKNAPRIIDIDIILYEGVETDTPELTLPHKEMRNRAFVLQPLCELTDEFSDALEGVKDQRLCKTDFRILQSIERFVQDILKTPGAVAILRIFAISIVQI